jgi:ribonuclease III
MGEFNDVMQMKTLFKNGDFKLHILNEQNKPITKKVIESILKKYGLNHKVRNLQLFQTAMTHISYMTRSTITDKVAKILKDVPPIDDDVDMNDVMPLQDTHYETLELLGDSVLHSALAWYLKRRYPTKDEGFITKLRSKIERAESLSELSKKIGLQKYAVIARNVELNGGRESNVHLTEDIFESFFGALLLDLEQVDETTCDYLCKKIFIAMVEQEIDIAEMINNDDNYKDRLMQHFHKLNWSEPKYYEDPSNSIKNTNSQETRKFIMYVKNSQMKVIGVGEGVNKSKAEQSAAKSALVTLGVINEAQIHAQTENDFYGEVSDDEISDSEDNATTKKKPQSKLATNVTKNNDDYAEYEISDDDSSTEKKPKSNKPKKVIDKTDDGKTTKKSKIKKNTKQNKN